MTTSEKFSEFCSNLLISSETVSTISYRYKRMTKRLNQDFWDSDSENNRSFYVGSYGRDTDIHVSDIDMIFQLPYDLYNQYNKHQGNGQSALLQKVKNSIERTYSFTKIGADGQVIKVPFEDGVVFELVPVFLNKDGSFTFPDSNDGGSWRVTDPKPEIKAIETANQAWNYNLKRLARMARAWKDKWSVPIGGLLIDTLAYNFLKNWEYKENSYHYYDWMTRDFFEFIKNQNQEQQYWLAPGSNQYVWRKGLFEYKALRCYNLAIQGCEYETKGQNWSANQKWREIYGSSFPL